MSNTITAALDLRINQLNEEDFLLPESFWEKNIINPMKRHYPMSTFFLTGVFHGLAHLTYCIFSPVALLALLAESFFRFILLVTTLLTFPLFILADYFVIRPIALFMGWRHRDIDIIDVLFTDLDSKIPSILLNIHGWLNSRPTLGFFPPQKNPDQVDELTLTARHTAKLLFSGELYDFFEKKQYNPEIVYSVDLSWAMPGLTSTMREGLQKIIEKISEKTDWNVRNLSLRGNFLAYNADARTTMKKIFQSIPGKVKTLDLRDNQLSTLSPQEMISLGGTLPSVEKLYVSLDEINAMSREQYDALTNIASKKTAILVFDQNNKLANHRAKHKPTYINNLIGLNYLGGGIVPSNTGETDQQTENKKPYLPLPIIDYIASYIFGDSIMKYLHADPKNTSTAGLNNIVRFFGRPHANPSPKPTRYWGCMNFFSKPRSNELPLLANEENIENNEANLNA